MYMCLCVYGECIHVCTDRYTECFTHKEDMCDVYVHVCTATQADMPTKKVCVVYVFMYIQIHRRIYPQRGQRRTSYILVCHVPPYCLETGSLTESGARPGTRNPSDSLVSTFRRARVISVHDPHNVRSAEDLNSGPYVCTARLLTHRGLFLIKI